jgi:hypothetical protein
LSFEAESCRRLYASLSRGLKHRNGTAVAVPCIAGLLMTLDQW